MVRQWRLQFHHTTCEKQATLMQRRASGGFGTFDKEGACVLSSAAQRVSASREACKVTSITRYLTELAANLLGFFKINTITYQVAPQAHKICLWHTLGWYKAPIHV